MERSAIEAWNTARPSPENQSTGLCVAPWVSMEFDPSGWVYTCCANQQYPLGRIGDDRLRDLWAGPRARVLRDALGRNDLSVGCGSCRWHLEHGRMDPDAAVYDRYPVVGHDPSGPASMTFALSNRCNLGCVMCTPELSSTLRRAAGMPRIESRYGEAFYEDLAPFLPGLRYAKFLGGEPFLIPEHHRVWDLMDSVGGPPRMQVTTNGTIWNDRVAWLLERFRFDVTLSIDATTAPTYEAIRQGASFEVVQANIDRFSRACQRAGTEFRLCFCLMDQNHHELAPMVAWADSLGAPLSVNLVSDPGFALHDRTVDALEAVRRAWTDQAHSSSFTTNAEVWAIQVKQLDAVIAERRAGIAPTPRNAQLGPASIGLGPDGASPPEATLRELAASSVRSERDRMLAWAGGESVGEIHVDPTGRVVAVPRANPGLGIGDRLVGTPADQLMWDVATRESRRPWPLSVDLDSDGRTVRTVALSAERPDRGSVGAMVRLVTVPAVDGYVVFVAVDRIYDQTTTSVALGSTGRH